MRHRRYCKSFAASRLATESKPHTDSAPRWSPDCRTLAFLSDRQEDGQPEIYLIDRDGGEARQLTNLRGAIDDLEWSPNGRYLAFLLTDPETEEDQRRKQAKDDAIEVERNHKLRRLWTVDIRSGETRQVTGGDAQIWEFSWAPDCGFALIVGSVEAFSSFYASNFKEVIVFFLIIPVLVLRSLAAPEVEEEKD